VIIIIDNDVWFSIFPHFGKDALINAFFFILNCFFYFKISNIRLECSTWCLIERKSHAT